MPVLRTVRHELFAQQIAAGKSRSEAALLAGIADTKYLADRASCIMNKPEVIERVDEILRRQADKIGFGAGQRLIYLKDIVEFGIDMDDNKAMKNPDAAIRAIKETNKMCGDYAPLKLGPASELAQVGEAARALAAALSHQYPEYEKSF